MINPTTRLLVLGVWMWGVFGGRLDNQRLEFERALAWWNWAIPYPLPAAVMWRQVVEERMGCLLIFYNCLENLILFLVFRRDRWPMDFLYKLKVSHLCCLHRFKLAVVLNLGHLYGSQWGMLHYSLWHSLYKPLLMYFCNISWSDLVNQCLANR